VFGLRAQELVFIFLILFLLFGAARLPQLGKSLGSAIRNFKKGISTDEEHKDENEDEDEEQTAHKNLEANTNASSINPSKIGSKN